MPINSHCISHANFKMKIILTIIFTSFQAHQMIQVQAYIEGRLKALKSAFQQSILAMVIF
jgi:hypothetical protein